MTPLEKEVIDLRARLVRLDRETKQRDEAQRERWRRAEEDRETAQRWNDLNNNG